MEKHWYTIYAQEMFFFKDSAVKTCGIIKTWNLYFCNYSQITFYPVWNSHSKGTHTEGHACRKATIFNWLNFPLFIPIVYTLTISFLLHAFKISTLLGYFWRRRHLSHFGKKKKRTENKGAAAELLCESDRGMGRAFACCFSLTLRRYNGGRQTDGAMLFISETPTATFSHRRRSGGVRGIPKRAARGTLARPVSEALRWAGLGVRMYLMSAKWSGTGKIMFCWHFSKVMWCFFWLKTALKEGVMIKERKGGRRSLLCTVRPYPLQKSVASTVYWLLCKYKK